MGSTDSTIAAAALAVRLRPLSPALIAGACVLLSLDSARAEPSSFKPKAEKTTSTFYGPDRRAIVAANAKRYAWAAEQVAAAEREAAPYLALADEALWQSVPAPELLRATGVNRNLGCPKCGRAIYGQRGPNLYTFEPAVSGHPWKVRCPNCRELFPKNDFAAFYASGISPRDGLFHAELADRKLLFNAEHPDPNHPLHRWCVDDGTGWIDADGGLHAFVATHNYRIAWRVPTHGVQTLARAYALTGKPEYAHKATILLDRLADVFPRLNGGAKQLSDLAPGRYAQGLIGPDYWSADGWAGLAMAYDMIYDGMNQDRTLAFLRARAAKFEVPSPKNTLPEIRRHIEQRIFVDRFAHRETYWMNGTLTEMAEAKVDLVLRGRAAIESFAHTHMPRIVPDEFLNADGSGNEGALGYDHGAFVGYGDLLVDLASFDADLAKRVIAEYPKLRAAFDFWPDIWCVGRYVPNIGDSEAGPEQKPDIPWRAAPYLKLYELTGDERYARMALTATGGDVEKLPRSVFDAEPEATIAKAREVYRRGGRWEPPSVAKPDCRLAILRSGRAEAAIVEPSDRDDRIAAWLYYRTDRGTSSHKHFDALNIGLFAFGLPLVCEQGYPLFTGEHPSRWQWTSHTRSHATVTIDDQPQQHRPGGKLLGFGAARDIQFVSVDAREAYDAATRYRRTLVLIDHAPGVSFIADVFRVQGGRRHAYTIPLYYGEPRVHGLDLADHDDLYGGYVERVRSAKATAPWFVDIALHKAWRGAAAGNLRVQGLGDGSQVLLGSGQTRLGSERPERIPYVVFERTSPSGSPLDSTFVLLYEPYRKASQLAAQPLRYSDRDGVAELEITTTRGDRYILAIDDRDPNRTTLRATHHAGNTTDTFDVDAPADSPGE